jgi:hypothetical protein
MRLNEIVTEVLRRGSMDTATKTWTDAADAERQRQKGREQLEARGVKTETIEFLLEDRYGEILDTLRAQGAAAFYKDGAPGITVGGVKLSDRPLLLLLDEEM